MNEDVILELLKIIITGAILVILFHAHRKHKYARIPGWKWILAGFALIFIGNVFDLTDNFESLNKYIIIGDTDAEAFIEKFVGFLLGFLFIFNGLRKWIPIVMTLEEAKVKAEEASKAKSMFLANMSHELRTPLHGILSYAKLGEDKSKDKPKDYFHKIHVSGERLLHLLDDLLDLSKLSSHKIVLEKHSVDLYEIAQSMAEECQALLEDKKLHFTLEKPNIPTTTMADIMRIEQVVRNLLSNAIKFTHEGKHISINFAEKGNNIQLSVSDEGVGIPKKELETIFDEFIQSSQTNTGAGGTGLGLAICRQIIEQHDGTITAENNESGGATFRVNLPKTN